MSLLNPVDRRSSGASGRHVLGALAVMLLLLCILPLSKVRVPEATSGPEFRPLQVQPQPTPALQQAPAEPSPSPVPTALPIPELSVHETAAVAFSVPQPPELASFDTANLKPQVANLPLPTFEQENPSDLNLFDVAELDFSPSLIHVPAFRFPAKLSREGVHEGSVTLVVRVDPRGSVSVLEVSEASHEALIPAVMSAVVRARFQSPRREGKAVSMRYYWTLNLQDELHNEGGKR